MLFLDRVDIQADRGVTTEVDEYVPVAVEISHLEPAPTIYWRAKPSHRTLVEVGFSSKTGRFRSATVTAIDAASVVQASSGAKQVEEDEALGVPCFGLADWRPESEFAARFRDEDVAARLVLGNRSCSVELGQPAAAKFFVKFGNLRFSFDDQRALVRIDIESLDDRQIGILRRLAPSL